MKLACYFPSCSFSCYSLCSNSDSIQCWKSMDLTSHSLLFLRPLSTNPCSLLLLLFAFFLLLLVFYYSFMTFFYYSFITLSTTFHPPSHTPRSPPSTTLRLLSIPLRSPYCWYSSPSFFSSFISFFLLLLTILLLHIVDHLLLLFPFLLFHIHRLPKPP